MILSNLFTAADIPNVSSALAGAIANREAQTKLGAPACQVLNTDRSIAISGDTAVSISGITSDSRKVKPGYLFAALPGASADGTAFIDAAIAAGAVALLLSDEVSITGYPTDITIIESNNVACAFAKSAAAFYGVQPAVQVAVTGTNGKTSVTTFLRQIWDYAGHEAANIGTIGVTTKAGTKSSGLTTPSPEVLHETLAQLKQQGITHVAMEASSHGIVQHRLSGVQFCAGAFTNLTRDHLDYHGTFEAYRDAKAALFTQLLPKGAPAIIDVDSEEGVHMVEIARTAGCDVRSVGKNGAYIKLLGVQSRGFSQLLSLAGPWGHAEVILPLAGQFQVQNALVAAGLALATGISAPHVFAALQQIVGASGRLEPCGTWNKQGAFSCAAFVDYAHTPDALENAILALRPYVQGKLITVFGCGGDRDAGKRPLMGAVAQKLSDVVIVTDDNPRSEAPASIRAAILAAAPKAQEIGDRAQAIHAAIAMAQSGDIVLVAGKGHETGQIIAGVTHPFSDHEVIAQAIKEL